MCLFCHIPHAAYRAKGILASFLCEHDSFYYSRAARAVPCGLPRILRDWYQNVPQDVYFDIFDVPKKITLAKFGFLTNFVQPRDEKMSISEMGVGTLNSS